MRRIAAALFVFTLICSLARLAPAQEGSATLTGFIQDPGKAVIPGVKVTAIDTATNQRYEATTGNDGSYTIVSLPVGPYQMQIEKPGFKTILKDDLFLHTQDALEINFEMAVGSTSETVTVNGATSNDNPAVSLTVDREFVENMPLNGESFQDLIQLAPGTADAPKSSNAAASGYYSVDGQRADSNNFTVDGVSANLGGIENWASSQGGALAGSTPMQTAVGTTQGLASIDALQEFSRSNIEQSINRDISADRNESVPNRLSQLRASLWFRLERGSIGKVCSNCSWRVWYIFRYGAASDRICLRRRLPVYCERPVADKCSAATNECGVGAPIAQFPINFAVPYTSRIILPESHGALYGTMEPIARRSAEPQKCINRVLCRE
jgi:hypothetical protein